MENAIPAPVPRRRRTNIWYFILPAIVILVAAAIWYLLKIAQDECYTTVAKEDAVRLHQYWSQEVASGESIRYHSFSIGLCQLEAMKKELEMSPDAAACRLYLGYEPKSKDTCVLVVAAKQGDNGYIDIVNDKVLKTGVSMVGFCPRFCDEPSPLFNPEWRGELGDIQLDRAVSIEEAQSLISMSRLIEVSPVPGPFAMVIPKEMVTLMERAAEGREDIAGFRSYFGASGKTEIDAIVIVPVTADGRDLTERIFAAKIRTAGLCPPHCDAASPFANPEF